MYDYKAKVIRVVDGDTIECVVDTGFRNSTTQIFRLLFIDAPEMHGVEKPLGEISKKYLTARLLDKTVMLQSYKADTNIDRDSFGRWLAVIFLEDETGEKVDINDEMIKLGYAVPYKK